MSLLFKPHSLSYEPPSQTIAADKSVRATSYGATSTVRGQVTPESHAVIAERFGILELKRPHLLLTDEDVTLAVAGKLTMGTRVFEVKAGPETFNALPVAAHNAYALDQLDYA